MNTSRPYGLFMTLIAREERAFKEAMAALDDPSQSEDMRRQKIKEFVESGQDMIAAANSEVH